MAGLWKMHKLPLSSTNPLQMYLGMQLTWPCRTLPPSKSCQLHLLMYVLSSARGRVDLGAAGHQGGLVRQGEA